MPTPHHPTGSTRTSAPSAHPGRRPVAATAGGLIVAVLGWASASSAMPVDGMRALATGDPIDLVVALAGVALTAAGCWLAIIGSLAIAASAGATVAQRAVRLLAPASVRRAVLGMGAATAIGLAAAPAAVQVGAAPAAAHHLVAAAAVGFDGTAAADPEVGPSDRTQPPPELRLLDPPPTASDEQPELALLPGGAQLGAPAGHGPAPTTTEAAAAPPTSTTVPGRSATSVSATTPSAPATPTTVDAAPDTRQGGDEERDLGGPTATASPADQPTAPPEAARRIDVSTAPGPAPRAADPAARLPTSASPSIGGRPAATELGAAPATTWTIARGEHLWLVAEAVLAQHRGGPATVAEVASYHQQLIAANLETLPVPTDPDLVFAGTVITCPTPT